MRKLLFITTALVGFAFAAPAEAAPVAAWVAGSVFGLTAGTVGFAIVSGVVSMAISVGLSFLAQKMLNKKPKQEAIRAELARPTSLPAYRFVYGKTWAPGTPVGWKVVGKRLYICYLLNSRPSAGPFTVLLDKRAVSKSGNEFDFDGPGAEATNAPWTGGYARYWIGDGTQTRCPAVIVSETSGHFSASDAWRGRTVLWMKLHAGSDEDRAERWPATPPEVNVDGNWSLVHDPRDGQTKFSRNQALCVLDALRNNPVRPYGDAHLMRDSFVWAANVAGQSVAAKDGSTIGRYRCDGVLVFSDGSELEDQIQPLLDAGAARLSRVGGRLAIIPAEARGPVRTITDVTDGQPLDLVRWKPSDELYTEVTARFPAPDRAYESAETPVHVVPGAQAADGGIAKRLTVDLDFVTDHRQAQRVAKIMVMRTRMQRRISAELFPDCFDLVAGSVAQVNLGAPYGAWAGKYEVESIAPAAGINDDQSVTIRLPAVLTETDDAIHAWSPATDERDMLAGDFSGAIGRVQPPPKPTLTTGSAAAQTSGDTVVPGVIAAWAASLSPSVTAYDWEWRKVLPIPSWRAGGRLSTTAADNAGVYSANIAWPEVGAQYQVRVRSIGRYGQSEWVYSDPVTAAGPSQAVAVPQSIAAVPAGATRINITAVQASDRNARELLIYANGVNSPLTASLLHTVPAGASVTVSRSETGLTTGATRFYFARARDQWGNLSDFTDSASATTA